MYLVTYPSEFVPVFLIVLVGFVLFKLLVFMFLVPCCDMSVLLFPRETMFGWSVLPFVQQGVHGLFMLFVFIYVHVYWCPTRFPYQMIHVFVSFNTADSHGEQEFLTLLELIAGFQRGSCRWIFNFFRYKTYLLTFLRFIQVQYIHQPSHSTPTNQTIIYIFFLYLDTQNYV